MRLAKYLKFLNYVAKTLKNTDQAIINFSLLKRHSFFTSYIISYKIVLINKITYERNIMSFRKCLKQWCHKVTVH